MLGLYTNFNNNTYLNQNYSNQGYSYNPYQQTSLLGGYSTGYANNYTNSYSSGYGQQNSNMSSMLLSMISSLLPTLLGLFGNTQAVQQPYATNNANYGQNNIFNSLLGSMFSGTQAATATTLPVANNASTVINGNSGQNNIYNTIINLILNSNSTGNLNSNSTGKTPVSVEEETITVESNEPKKAYIISNNNHGNNEETLNKEVKKYDKKIDLSDDFMNAVNKFVNSDDAEAQKINAKYGTEMAKQAVIIDEDGNLIGVMKTADLSKELGGVKLGGTLNKNTAVGKTLDYSGTTYEIAGNVFASPLTFDLNGDGVKTSDKIIDYDIDGDGKLDKINDVADGTLSIRGGKDGKDLFGNNTDLDGNGKADGFSNGFEALKALAQKEGLINGKDDMVLDSKDLKVLEDKYQFGMKTEGYNSEVKSLEELGITEINLGASDEVTETADFDGQDNLLMEQEGASFKINGEDREYADVWHEKK